MFKIAFKHTFFFQTFWLVDVDHIFPSLTIYQFSHLKFLSFFNPIENVHHSLSQFSTNLPHQKILFFLHLPFHCTFFFFISAFLLILFPFHMYSFPLSFLSSFSFIHSLFIHSFSFIHSPFSFSFIHPLSLFPFSFIHSLSLFPHSLIHPHMSASRPCLDSAYPRQHEEEEEEWIRRQDLLPLTDHQTEKAETRCVVEKEDVKVTFCVMMGSDTVLEKERERERERCGR